MLWPVLAMLVSLFGYGLVLDRAKRDNTIPWPTSADYQLTRAGSRVWLRRQSLPLVYAAFGTMCLGVIACAMLIIGQALWGFFRAGGHTISMLQLKFAAVAIAFMGGISMVKNIVLQIRGLHTLAIIDEDRGVLSLPTDMKDQTSEGIEVPLDAVTRLSCRELPGTENRTRRAALRLHWRTESGFERQMPLAHEQVGGSCLENIQKALRPVLKLPETSDSAAHDAPSDPPAGRDLESNPPEREAVGRLRA